MKRTQGINAASWFYGQSFNGRVDATPSAEYVRQQEAKRLADQTDANLEAQLRASLIATFDVRYSPGYCCWLATEQSYDSPESPLGHGSTRDEAIDDLIETLESRRNRRLAR